jgi:hypothetical protein
MDMDAATSNYPSTKTDLSALRRPSKSDRSSATSELHAAWRQLAELNYRFLESPQCGVFPGATRTALQSLSSSARRALAAAPFSLFSIVLPSEVPSSFDIHDGDRGAPTASDWTFAVAFYVWHLAHTDESALSMLCDVPEAQAHRLRSLPVTAVPAIAAFMATRIEPRWLRNPLFWPTAIRCATVGDVTRLRTVHLLGRQLLAAGRL